MEKPRSQISLRAAFWTTTAVAWYVAFLSQLEGENLPGLVATLFAQASFWLLTGIQRARG
jgi:hypothetical protein